MGNQLASLGLQLKSRLVGSAPKQLIAFPREEVPIRLDPNVFPQHLHQRIKEQIVAYNREKDYVPADFLPKDRVPQISRPRPRDEVVVKDWNDLPWRRKAGQQDYLAFRKDRTDRTDDFDESGERSMLASLSVTWFILGFTTTVLVVFVFAHFYYESREWARREQQRSNYRRRLRELERRARAAARDSLASSSPHCPPNSAKTEEGGSFAIAHWLADVEPIQLEMDTYHPSWESAREAAPNGSARSGEAAAGLPTAETRETMLEMEWLAGEDDDEEEEESRASVKSWTALSRGSLGRAAEPGRKYAATASAALMTELRSALAVKKKASIFKKEASPRRSRVPRVLRRLWSGQGRPLAELGELARLSPPPPPPRPLRRRLSLLNVLNSFRM